eukprot:10590454-Ditylum_brightwellii.AAC.1
MLEALFSGRWDKEIQCDGLEHSSEDNISGWLDVEKELKPMLDSTMTYFGIKQTTPSPTLSSST